MEELPKKERITAKGGIGKRSRVFIERDTGRTICVEVVDILFVLDCVEVVDILFVLDCVEVVDILFVLDCVEVVDIQ